MTRMEEQIWAWHVARYGTRVRMAATFRKLCEEIGELGEAMLSDEIGFQATTQMHVREEIADCVILLFTLLQGVDKGCSLWAVVGSKMETLWERLQKGKK